MSTYTDEKYLIKCTQQDDTDTFNPLVRKYQSHVYNHILGRVKNTEAAKDLTQETWLKAFRAINTFRGDPAFSSWLYRIAKNVCIDHFRKQKHYNAIEPLHIVDEHRITDTHHSPCQDIERQELREHLRAAIQHLTPIRKKVFHLYYVQELSIKAIAQHIGRSEGTIKTHLRNARLQLRKHLAPYQK